MEEWRAVVRLGTGSEAAEVEQAVREQLGHEAVVRDGKSVFAYAGSRSQALHMQVVLQRAAANTVALARLERFDGSSWDDEERVESFGTPGVDLTTAEWEVRVVATTSTEARRVEKWLREDVTRVSVRRGLAIPVESRKDGEALVDRLRSEAGTTARFEVRPIGRLRRWLLRHRSRGSHAYGGGGGWFGDGGGGDGGGGGGGGNGGGG